MDGKDKREKSPLRWLLLIPLQLLVAKLLVWAGVQLDTLIFSGSEGMGHGIPIFSALFLLLAAVGTLLAVVAAAVLTVRSLLRRRNSQEKQ